MTRLGRAIPAGLAAVLVLSGCSVSAASPSAVPAARRTVAGTTTPASAKPTAVVEARQGRPARSSRVRFVPERVSLPGGASAEVLPAQTVAGELKVPEHVQHVGWWDGSSYAGDPFGSTVIAGHVDSATEGLGFFARLRRVRVGDRVTLTGAGHRLVYRVVSVRVVVKRALATDGLAFDQTGDPKLVLITCAGSYHRDRGGYDSNLVVTAVPAGLAR